MDVFDRKDDALYEQYEELLLLRDQRYLEAEGYAIQYAAIFGDLVTAIFEEKIACIQQKKAIAFCQTAINQGKLVNVEQLERYLEDSMALYYEQLNEMTVGVAEAKNAPAVSFVDVNRAKKIYRRLAKKIHPDLNPQTAEILELKDLWNRIMAAYHEVNPLKLSELEVLVNHLLRQCGIEVEHPIIPELEEKIESVENEINEIISTEPYKYKDLLDDEKAIVEKKQSFEEELEKCKAYHKELDGILQSMIAEGGVRFLWNTDSQ